MTSSSNAFSKTLRTSIPLLWIMCHLFLVYEMQITASSVSETSHLVGYWILGSLKIVNSCQTVLLASREIHLTHQQIQKLDHPLHCYPGIILDNYSSIIFSNLVKSFHLFPPHLSLYNQKHQLKNSQKNLLLIPFHKYDPSHQFHDDFIKKLKKDYMHRDFFQLFVTASLVNLSFLTKEPA